MINANSLIDECVKIEKNFGLFCMHARSFSSFISCKTSQFFFSKGLLIVILMLLILIILIITTTSNYYEAKESTSEKSGEREDGFSGERCER